MGQHALVEGSADGSITRGRWTQQVSLGGLRTDGFMFDRDEAVITARTRASFGTTSSIGASIADKAFGANGFYGNSPSREWTQAVVLDGAHALLARDGMRVDGAGRVPDASGSLPVGHPAPGIRREQAPHARGHGRDRPGGAGGSALERGIRVEGPSDWIRSSNLGDHAQARGGAYVDAQGALGTRAHASVGLRVDRYDTFGTAWAPSMGVGAWVTGHVRLRGAVSRSFRVPTFTERYYRDPAHIATADLDPERAWAGDLAVDWVPHPQWVGTVALFARRERDVIDWVKAAPADRWNTRNILRVDARGLELSLKRALGTGAFVSLDYAFTDVDPGDLSLMSKYTLDYARHGFAVTASTTAWRGIGLGTTIGVRQRTQREAYVLADVRVSRPFARATLFVDVKNLFDQDYEEIRGIDMPGRWITAGVRIGRSTAP